MSNIPEIPEKDPKGPQQPKDYFLYEDQLEELYWLKKRVENYAEDIFALCSKERDDIEYGFTLGKIHTYLREDFVTIMELEDTIKKQKI